MSVPLQHNAPVAQLRPIIAETEPKVVAVGVQYLDLAVESALDSASLRHLVVFDFDPAVDDHRESVERARTRLRDAGMAVIVETLADVVERGRATTAGTRLHRRHRRPAGDDHVHLGKHRRTQRRDVSPSGPGPAVDIELPPSTDIPVINVNFMPLNHVGGRLPLTSFVPAGGTSYFVRSPTCRRCSTTGQLVRPTDMPLVPRVVDMLFQRYRSAVDRLVADGVDQRGRRGAAATPSCATTSSADG